MQTVAGMFPNKLERAEGCCHQSQRTPAGYKEGILYISKLVCPTRSEDSIRCLNQFHLVLHISKPCHKLKLKRWQRTMRTKRTHLLSSRRTHSPYVRNDRARCPDPAGSEMSKTPMTATMVVSKATRVKHQEENVFKFTQK